MSSKRRQKNFALQRLLKLAFFSWFFVFCCQLDSNAQKDEQPEEVGLMLTVPRVGSTEIPALIKGDTAFLSISTLFEYLKIKSRMSPDADSITGFLLTPAASFTISKVRNKIFYQEKMITLQRESLLGTGSDLFLRSDYFGKIFGLDCEFDFRSLSVTLKTKLELPVIREMQMEAMRKNVGQLKGERKADTTIGRKFPLFRLGVADWNINASQVDGNAVDTRMNLALGAVFMGGEVNANLNVAAGKPFDERMQFYRWRYVNNDNSLVKQISVGKLFPEATSTLPTAVKGVQFSNAPTTYRKSFGTYIISNTTEPGWIVELYVNSILVNYTKADASGFYTFEVPMVYGTSNIKLRFYGPWGEEKTKEESVVIPFGFLPEHQFEYTLTGGLVNDQTNEKFARANLKYGLGSFVTLGGGMEYYSAVTSGKNIPYVSAALRLLSNIILYGEHTYGVRTKAMLNYRHSSNLQVDLNYTKYTPGQTAIKFLEERRAVVSMPFRGKKYTAFTRLSVYQRGDIKHKVNAAELLVSSFFSGVSSNFSTYAEINKPGNPLIRSNLSLTFRLPKQLRYTQQLQYEYENRKVSMFRSDIEKCIFKKSYLNLTYERNVLANANSFTIGLRFDLSGLQAGLFAFRSAETTTTLQSVRGSLLYDDNIDRLQFRNESSIGRGNISIVPFLDLNCNGKRDPGEQKLCGLKVRINGGRISHCSKDTTIQVTGLEAYANYLLEIDKSSFDNVAWQIKKPLINIVVEPNYFKTVEVPVAVMGEVEGRVMMETNGEAKGQGRMIVRFFKEGKQIARVMTEADGYFNYMGFAPGSYTAEIDREQLKNVGLEAKPGSIPFTINVNPEGELISSLKFVLKQKGE